jgi:DNA-binding NtrC family response regulator
VVLIDDEAEVTALAEKILRGAGYRVSGFTDPSAALDALRDARVLVVDSQMPGTSGLEVCRAALSARPGLGLVLCSGYLTLEVKAQARELGAVEFVEKPFRSETLIAAVADVLRA